MTAEHLAELKRLAHACPPFYSMETTPYREFVDAVTPQVVAELIAEIEQFRKLLGKWSNTAVHEGHCPIARGGECDCRVFQTRELVKVG